MLPEEEHWTSKEHPGKHPGINIRAFILFSLSGMLGRLERRRQSSHCQTGRKACATAERVTVVGPCCLPLSARWRKHTKSAKHSMACEKGRENTHILLLLPPPPTAKDWAFSSPLPLCRLPWFLFVSFWTGGQKRLRAHSLTEGSMGAFRPSTLALPRWGWVGG